MPQTGISGLPTALLHATSARWSGYPAVQLVNQGAEPFPPANKGDRVALILALSEFYRDRFKNIRLFVLNPYDIVLSKLSRNLERERQDVAYLTKTKNLDGNVLQKRYEEELRIGLIGPPARHDQTLRFWSEAYFGASGKT